MVILVSPQKEAVWKTETYSLCRRYSRRRGETQKSGSLVQQGGGAKGDWGGKDFLPHPSSFPTYLLLWQHFDHEILELYVTLGIVSLDRKGAFA
jgi:hypothetical protein